MFRFERLSVQLRHLGAWLCEPLPENYIGNPSLGRLTEWWERWAPGFSRRLLGYFATVAPEGTDPVAAAMQGARQRQRMTQAHLALAAAVSERTVRRAEAGARVGHESLRSLCAALDITMPHDRRRHRPRWQRLGLLLGSVALFLAVPCFGIGLALRNRRQGALAALVVVGFALWIEWKIRVGLLPVLAAEYDPGAADTPLTLYRALGDTIALYLCGSFVGGVLCARGSGTAGRSPIAALTVAGISLLFLSAGPLAVTAARADGRLAGLVQSAVLARGWSQQLQARNFPPEEQRQMLLALARSIGLRVPTYLADAAAFEDYSRHGPAAYFAAHPGAP